ncbi:triose-phosphate transporter family-domain-containing protein [Obelidium mucronatum]|nr:triose-phosphate transporter family-domain-containing protein [Obelidium mucronatum]
MSETTPAQESSAVVLIDKEEGETLLSVKVVSSEGLHPSIYIAIWILSSGSVILFNKYILHTLDFPFPIFLTTCHLIFATLSTRILERSSNLLDGLKVVKITQDVYVKAILPIGFLFSLSLVFCNVAYLYLSVPFIQMLKAVTPVVVLLIGYALGTDKVDCMVLVKVTLIVTGVIIASYGEIEFVFLGFVIQGLGILFEATRLVLVQKLLKEHKMDPMVSLYYFAPVCAVINGLAFLIFESHLITWDYFNHVGFGVLFLNCCTALALNVAVVFLIGKTSSLVMCLSGVFKDILLVVVSVFLWNSPVSPLQVFGYGLALIGMVWYKQADCNPLLLICAFTATTLASTMMVAHGGMSLGSILAKQP